MNFILDGIEGWWCCIRCSELLSALNFSPKKCVIDLISILFDSFFV